MKYPGSKSSPSVSTSSAPAMIACSIHSSSIFIKSGGGLTKSIPLWVNKCLAPESQYAKLVIGKNIEQECKIKILNMLSKIFVYYR